MGMARVSIGHLILTICLLGISKSEAAIFDDAMWHRYVAAMSALRDVECQYQMWNRSGGDGAPDMGDGFFLRTKYTTFRWNLVRDYHYLKYLGYKPYEPPYDWLESVDFKSDKDGGYFNCVQYAAIVTKKKSEVMPFLIPNPVGFFTGGMNMPVAELTNSDVWDISVHDLRLVLRGKTDNTRLELDLDSAHGWLPKRAEHHFENSIVALIVDRYHRDNGVWFPVEMHLERRDRKGDGFVPVREVEYKLVVDPKSVKCNPNLGVEVYRFDIPDGSFISNRDTGRRHEGELGLAKIAEFQSRVRSKDLELKSMRGWFPWLGTGFVMLCAAIIVCAIWRRKFKMVAMLIGIALPAVLVGCNRPDNVQEKKAKTEAIIEISDSTQSVTGQTGTALEGDVSFSLTNVSLQTVQLVDPIAQCSCIKEMTFDKDTLAPKETAELKVRFLQKVGMDPQRYQVGFGARTPEGVEPYQVFLQILPDRDWNFHLPDRMTCVSGIPTEFEMLVNFTGIEPEGVEILSPSGLTVSNRTASPSEKGVVRYLVTALMPGAARVATTDIVLATSNKTPKQLTHSSLLTVEHRVRFSSPAYFWDGESVRLPVFCSAGTTVILKDVSDPHESQLMLQYDSHAGEICVTRRDGFVPNEVTPLSIKLVCDLIPETITTTLVLHR
jgi:hypothetical protein